MYIVRLAQSITFNQFFAQILFNVVLLILLEMSVRTQRKSLFGPCPGTKKGLLIQAL